MSWDEARDYAKQLRYAGFRDWRLPTKADLESLVIEDLLNEEDEYEEPPLIDPFKTPDEGCLFSGQLVFGDRPDQPWIMNLRNGHIFNGHKYRGFVRAVRDAPADSR